MTATRDGLSSYWRTYGGFRAIFRSPALWVALAITGICSPYWLKNDWAATSISILPNLLGFSIGAMAIVLAFPSTRMFGLIAEGGRNDSFYMDLAARFMHFILVQVCALILALLHQALSFWLVSLLGFWALVYAILTAAMTALSLYGVAELYNHPGAQDSDDSTHH